MRPILLLEHAKVLRVHGGRRPRGVLTGRSQEVGTLNPSMPCGEGASSACLLGQLPTRENVTTHRPL
eukprot:4192515-Pyramimonas_sp.AAC.1